MGAPAVLFCVWGRGGACNNPVLMQHVRIQGYGMEDQIMIYLNIKVTEIGLGLGPFPPSDKLSLIYSRIPYQAVYV